MKIKGGEVQKLPVAALVTNFSVSPIGRNRRERLIFLNIHFGFSNWFFRRVQRKCCIADLILNDFSPWTEYLTLIFKLKHAVEGIVLICGQRRINSLKLIG